MVATLNGAERAPRTSTLQREPHRALEALSNFYGRFSTDSGSHRPRNTDASLSSNAGSIRRSSSGTEFYSNAHSVNGGEELSSSLEASASLPKSPRVHSSFSAAAVASASRSSLEKRNSQASMPNNALASPSARNSPADSSPRTTSSALADASYSNSGGGGPASGLVSSSMQNKGTSVDIAAINHYSPSSLSRTFPWLSSTTDAASKRDRVSSSPLYKHGIAPIKTDSPPIEQYSRGKGFGWNPNKDHATPKSASNVRLGTSSSHPDVHSRGLGFKSSSELDLPERMRSQRKGAPAPPRLSQDPIAFSIEEELRPHAHPSRSDSAFSRFGRAFRRKSKTGGEMRADYSAHAPAVPPLPRTPRKTSSQTPPAKPSDPFAEKALKASSGFVGRTPSKMGSVAGLNEQNRGMSKVSLERQPPTSGDTMTGENASARTEQKIIVYDETRTGQEFATMPSTSQQDHALASQNGDEQALKHPDSDDVLLTTDTAPANASFDTPSPTSRPISDSSEQPLTTDSSSSNAHRSSLAFLASAISTGAITSEVEGASNEAQKESPESDEISQGLVDAHSPSHIETNATAPPSSDSTSRDPSADRRRLEPKSATRHDQIPSILTDFLSMDAELSAKDSEKQIAKTPSRSTRDEMFATDTSTDSSGLPMKRTISGNSDGRRSSASSSSKATRATKGVFMAPAAGPSMGGFVSPFYVAPLTSTDSGVATRASRPSGRRASATSDDSRSVNSGPRRGSSSLSSSLAIPDSAAVEEKQSTVVTRTNDDNADQPRELSETDKARKVKSFANLRASSKDQGQEALPRASTSRLPSPSALLHAPDDQKKASSPNLQPSVSTSAKGLPGLPSEESSPQSRSVSQRFFRRPQTSGAEAGLLGERSALSFANGEESTALQTGLVPGRASLDDAGRSSMPYSSSPTDNNFEMLAARDSSVTPSKSSEATERQSVTANMDRTRAFNLESKDSVILGRRPSEQSIGPISPSSSRLDSQGGAAGLFGNPQTRPRTSSLLPSFGFSRSRTGSSAGLEGSGKSPGTFGSSTRSASGGFRRDPSEPAGLSASNSQLAEVAEVNGGAQSPRVSSSSRPSFSRQLSASTGLSDAGAKQAKPEKKFSLSAFLPYEDEDAPEYAERIASTAPKSQIAAVLASSADTFYVDALHHFMTRFWFNSLPLDIALRKLLMDLHLPKETQQIDRVMEAFAKRYNECNSGLFASDDQPYILAFSLMMLHTDAFNKNAKNKMTKADYLRNTGASGVPTEILEYLYDNLTFTQFIYVEDEEGGKRRPSEASGMSLSAASIPSSLGSQSTMAATNRLRIDPYFLITQGRLGELRPDLEDVIPEDSPFSFTGSLSTFDVDRLNSAFLHAPSIEIVTTKTQTEQPGTATPNALEIEEEVVSLKVTKVGVVNRKDDVSDGGKKAASRKWKTSGLLLTGSQLLLFKDVIWINALQSQILDQAGDSLLCNGIPTKDDTTSDVVEGGVVISPRITYFKPDGVISLADAVAVKDNSYGKYDFVFRLLAAKGRQYLVQAQSEDDMNDWIHKINFCASFRTCNIKIRGLDLAPRSGFMEGLDRREMLEERLARANLSRTSFDHTSRRLDADDSGSSTPVADERGDSSREGTLRRSMEPTSRPSEFDPPARPRSSASHRQSPASSAIQKRARARREMMLTKIAETEVQLERATARLTDEIRLARHFAILTPFLKSTRDRIEMSALPLASRIRAHRLDVAKAQSRCQILRLDLAAGERVARALLPNSYLSSSAMRASGRMLPATMGTPQLLELGHMSDSQARFEELFAPVGKDGSSSISSSGYDSSSVPASLSGTVNKPASHQRNQMNLNAVSEQPADESPVMSSRQQLDEREEGASQVERRAAGDEVPEDWELSQVARPGTNRISLVDLPSPNELEQATGGRFRFGLRSAAE